MIDVETNNETLRLIIRHENTHSRREMPENFYVKTVQNVLSSKLIQFDSFVRRSITSVTIYSYNNNIFRIIS